MLRSPALAGLRRHDGELIEGDWEPIITRKEHEALLAALTRPRTERATNGRSHLLSGAGVIVCAECGRPMRRMSFRMKNGRVFDRHQCAKQPGQGQCGRVAITQASTDDYVTRRLLDFLARAELRPLEDVGSEDQLELQLAEANASLSELVHERFVRRRLGRDDYDRSRAALDAEVAHLEQQLSVIRRNREERSLAMPLGDRDPLQRWWDTASADEQTLAVRQAIRTVAVHPARRRGGNRFDELRLHISWRWDTWDLALHVAGRFEATAAPQEREAALSAYLDVGFAETQRTSEESAPESRRGG